MRILLDGFWSSFGILFLQWEAHFGTGASETSLIGSIFMMTLCGIGKALCNTIQRPKTDYHYTGCHRMTSHVKAFFCFCFCFCFF